MQKFKQTMLALLLALLSGCTAQPPALEFHDGWVRLPPPGMAMTAGFGRLENHLDRELHIVGASMVGAGDVSIHRTVIEDGVARMRPVERLSVPAGESVALAPGGLHLMIMQLEAPLTAGQTLALTLRSDTGEQYEVTLDVR